MKSRKLNLPNRLTIIRIFLTPFVVVFLISPSKITSAIAALIFAIASFTDWLDGYLARNKNQVTKLGKLLDPIADKLLVASALIPLVGLSRIPAWIAVFIICRDITVTGLRAVGASRGVVIQASDAGKLKMVLQICAIILLILDLKFYYFDFHLVGLSVLYVVLGLSLYSGIDYFIKFWKEIENGE